MKSHYPLLALIIIASGLVLIPLQIESRWLFVINIIVYISLGYFINSSQSNNRLFENKEGDSLPCMVQLYVWTVLIMALLSTSMSYNLHHGNCDETALSITIPASLWILLGISGVSYAGDISIPKNQSKPIEGFLFRYPTINDKYNGTNGTFNIEKLQFILFLVITASGYLALSFRLLSSHDDGTCITTLPELEESLTVLASISNGAYLAVKIAISGKDSSSPPIVPPA